MLKFRLMVEIPYNRKPNDFLFQYAIIRRLENLSGYQLLNEV